MPSIFQAIILGIVEGVTEFLPISSTGHLIVAGALLRLPNSTFLKSFEVVIQLGASLAVIVLYAKRLLVSFDLFKKVAVAFVPTAVIGLLLYKIIKTYLLGNLIVVMWLLAIGGVILLMFESWEAKRTAVRQKVAELSYKQAVAVGFFQAISIIPGVSRSAATIVGAMLVGATREAAVEFSFLLAIPTMVAASGLDIVKNRHELLVGGGFGVLGIGFVVSFVVALFVVKWLIKYVQTNSLQLFGAYRIVLAMGIWWLIH